MKIKIAAAAIFLIGCAIFVGSITRSQGVQKQDGAQPKSYVIQFVEYRSDNGGPLEPKGYWVRAVSSSGEWKETRYSFNGKVSSLVGAPDGMYLVQGDARQLIGESDTEFLRNSMGSNADREKAWNNHPQLLRIEQLAGLKTYVLKTPVTETETSYSLETGAVALKTVLRSNPGDTTPASVVEAIDVTFREVSKEEVQASPHLPLRIDYVGEKISAMRNDGRTKQAEALEQLIQKIKTNINN